MSNTEAAVTVQISGPHCEASVTRERRHGHRGAGMIDLDISRTTNGGARVCWNANRGRGWMKGWRATFATEQQAKAFAAKKWDTLVDWLAKADLSPGRSAAEVFSAQIA